MAMITRRKQKSKSAPSTSKRHNAARPTLPTAAMIALQHQRIRELAAASRQAKEAAIAESALIMATAPHAEEETEFTISLGADRFAD